MDQINKEQYEATINRLNTVISNMASSKAEDAVLIAELKAIITEQELLLKEYKTQKEV